MSVLFNAIMVYIVPVIIWTVWKRKSSARTFPLFVGMVSYIVISWLRATARFAILNDALKAHPWRFYFVMALITGIFEEGGRYIVFRYAAPSLESRTDCVSYGIGHGTIELLFTLNISNNTLFENLFDGSLFIRLIAFSAAMAVLVFASVHYKECKYLLAAAVGIHTLYDFLPAFYYCGNMPFLIDDTLLFLFLVAACWFAYKVYRHLDNS